MTLLAVPVPDAPRRALVLAGGGMRVAWQSGVVAALADAGLSFAHVDGTSGGTFTTGMLLSGLTPADMIQRWSTLDVHDFSSLLPFRDVVRGPAQWPALGDARGVRERVLPHLGVEVDAIRDATRRTGAVGTVNVCDFGTKTCLSVPNDELDLDVLVAAVSLPMLMPAVHRDGRVLTDAVWIKDANLLEAVRRGATEIWLVWCIGNTTRYGDGPFEQYVHMIEMSAGGGLNAELDVIGDINARRRAGEPVLGTTDPVVLHVVTPQAPLPLDPDFYAGRITADTLIDLGHRDACGYLSRRTDGGVALDPSATAMPDPPLGVRVRERLHGELGGLGRVGVDLVAEIRDAAAFAASPSTPVPVAGHVDRDPAGGDGGTRWLACDGSLAVDGDTVTYRLRLAGAPVEELVLRRRFDGVLHLGHALAALEVSDGDGWALGEVHAGAGDLLRLAAAVEPTGAHDLGDRAAAVATVTRLLFREAHHSST